MNFVLQAWLLKSHLFLSVLPPGLKRCLWTDLPFWWLWRLWCSLACGHTTSISALLSIRCPILPSMYASVSFSSSYKDTSPWIRAHPSPVGHHYYYLHLPRPYFKYSYILQFQGAMMFGGDTVQPSILPKRHPCCISGTWEYYLLHQRNE